eukprot:362033-Chlamydomonas_euryale.AAC.3
MHLVQCGWVGTHLPPCIWYSVGEEGHVCHHAFGTMWVGTHLPPCIWYSVGEEGRFSCHDFGATQAGRGASAMPLAQCRQGGARLLCRWRDAGRDGCVRYAVGAVRVGMGASAMPLARCGRAGVRFFHCSCTVRSCCDMCRSIRDLV